MDEPLLEIDPSNLKFGEPLGSGGFSDVFKGVLKFKEKDLNVAIKKLTHYGSYSLQEVRSREGWYTTNGILTLVSMLPHFVVKILKGLKVGGKRGLVDSSRHRIQWP